MSKSIVEEHHGYSSRAILLEPVDARLVLANPVVGPHGGEGSELRLPVEPA